MSYGNRIKIDVTSYESIDNVVYYTIEIEGYKEHPLIAHFRFSELHAIHNGLKHINV